MVSCVGLTTGDGGEGARITSRMFFGGRLYPEADESDCAAMGSDIAQTTTAATKKRFKAF
jgi:hypothetical protein